jgi:hypothetical protein
MPPPIVGAGGDPPKKDKKMCVQCGKKAKLMIKFKGSTEPEPVCRECADGIGVAGPGGGSLSNSGLAAAIKGAAIPPPVAGIPPPVAPGAAAAAPIKLKAELVPLSQMQKAPPAAVPPPNAGGGVDDAWEEFIDENTGRYYYFNEITNQTVWTKPANFRGPPALPIGWVEFQTDDGRSYYFHESTQKTVWERPTQ